MSDAERERNLLKAVLGRTPDCPDIELLAADVPNPDVERHAASCARCRAEIALLHQFEAAEPVADEAESQRWVEAELTRRRTTETAPRIAAPQAKPTAGFRGWRILSLVAACATLVVAVAVYQRQGDTGATVNNGPPVWRSTQVKAIAPVGDVTAAPAEFRWDAIAGASRYHARILEVDGTVAWEGDVAGNSMTPPIKLAAGRAFQWDVTALDAAGRKLGETGLQSFHILVTQR